MKRPCEKYHPVPVHKLGDVWEIKEGVCRLCWLYANDKDYNRLYGGNGLHEGPGALARASNFAAAFAEHAANNFRTVGVERQAIRRETCEHCDYFKPVTQECGHKSCGCGLSQKGMLQQIGIDKIAWESARCPEDKWSQTRHPVRFDHNNLCVGVGGLRFNCSMVKYGDGYLLCFRNGWEGSELFMVKLNSEFKEEDFWPLFPLNHYEANFGREDPRLFWHRGRLHVSYIGVSTNGGFHTSQLYARLTEDFRVEEVFYPHYSKRTFWEKNWVFFSYDNQLYAVYTVNPHRVLKIDGNVAKLAYEESWSPEREGGEMRGGASPILLDDEWYSFYHDNVALNVTHRKRYRTGLYTFSNTPPFRPKRYVPGMLLEATPTKNNYADVVFPGGAVLENGQWAVAHGVHDRSSEIYFFDASVVERSLRTCN